MYCKELYSSLNRLEFSFICVRIKRHFHSDHLLFAVSPLQWGFIVYIGSYKYIVMGWNWC